MKQRKLMVSGVLFVAGALALTACGGGSSSSSGGSSSGSATSKAQLTIYNIKPQNPLIPADTNEVGGSNIIDNVFEGLVRYDPTTAAPVLSMAESITASDGNKLWTVKLKPGQKFQDNTPVTAESFTKAWDWGADAGNGALNNYFYAPIKGYAALNPPIPKGAKKAPAPKVHSLTGLKVVSPTEFTVALTTPQSFFPVEVGYNAFFPLPDSFYADTKAFGAKPVGNGPFKVVSGDGDTGYKLARWDGYQGADKPKIAGATFKTYTSDTAAYADVQAGNLDFMDQVPASTLVGNQFEKDLPGQFVNKPVGVIATLTTPFYDANYKDPNLTKALSMAIDRNTITKTVFNGGFSPATGWVSPLVDGYKAGACGQYCNYNPIQAKTFLAKAKFKGPFVIGYNADNSSNKTAYDAVCNSIHNALGVACTTKPYVDFATFRTAITGYNMTTMFRTGWVMDYPSIQDFLEPLYVTGASSNDGKYSNPAFDALITKADGQSGDAALTTYQQAEQKLSDDMAVIPLWYENQQAVWSNRLVNVKTTPFETLDLADVTVK